MNQTKVDLHVHTTFSDGSYSPAFVVELAKQKGISTISITDHDNLDGLKEASERGKELGIEIIPGLELSTVLEEKEVHILAYFFDVKNRELKKNLSIFKDERYNRAKKIVENLKKYGFKISIKDVMKRANEASVGRPHIAHALVDLGYVSSFQEAFERFIGDRGPAVEKKILLPIKDAINLIRNSGGLTFVAHPCFLKEEFIVKLIDAGVDGIESTHPSHNESQTQFYKGLINQYQLLETGGSDFHGGKKMDTENFGKYYISGEQLEAMKNKIGKTNS